MKRLLLFIVFSFVLPSWAADLEAQVKPSRRVAFSLAPFDYLIGSFNLTLDIKVADKVSITLPVFYAHHDAALIKEALFWNSSLGLALGVKFFPIGSALDSGMYLTGEAGTFVVYPFERGTTHLFRGNSIYSEVQKSPTWLLMNSLRLGYQWVHDSGFLLDASAGVTLFHGFPAPEVRANAGWAF